ncbi:MAG: bifunctional UDP-N-acetylglucosamine diphosphorylase/glucosamine-1-phosphate N-acetyltransferase GlmU [Dehalococcoidia bacterium]
MTPEPLSRPLDGWVAVVLAAGRGTRMRSRLPKVLHTVAGRPMVQLVCETVREAGFEDIVIVTGDEDGEVAQAARRLGRVARQSEPLGTGHAALAAREAAASTPRVMILNADLPLLTVKTLREMAERHERSDSVLTFLTAYLDDPTGYGRVMRRNGRVSAIIEETETDATTRGEPEVNAGLYAANADWLWPTLEGLEPGPRGERYLTDVIALAVDRQERVQTYQVVESAEVQQVNTRVDLARAEAAMRDRLRRRLMLAGVTLVDPATTYVDVGVEVAEDVTLLPGVHLVGDTTIGTGCRIGPNTVLRDMTIGERCTIDASTLEGSRLDDEVTVGPYCHLRPGVHLASRVHLGNYVEVKASSIGADTRVGHFSYIGDAEVGEDVNIGAGTVTVNYDGEAKYRTRIGDRAFVGSDSMLVAPVEVGADAKTAAGAVVTHDVPPGEMVIGVPARPRRSAQGKE